MLGKRTRDEYSNDCNCYCHDDDEEWILTSNITKKKYLNDTHYCCNECSCVIGK